MDIEFRLLATEIIWKQPFKAQVQAAIFPEQLTVANFLIMRCHFIYTVAPLVRLHSWPRQTAASNLCPGFTERI